MAPMRALLRVTPWMVLPMLAACSADEAPTVIDPTADGAVSAADVAPPNDRADPLFDG